MTQRVGAYDVLIVSLLVDQEFACRRGAAFYKKECMKATVRKEVTDVGISWDFGVTVEIMLSNYMLLVDNDWVGELRHPFSE